MKDCGEGMARFDYLVIGNSAAGVSACEGIRRMDQAGSIGVVSDEVTMPYSRCLLTSYLSGKVPEKQLFFRPPGFYQKNRIELLLGKRAAGIDASAKLVALDDGQEVGYGKLLLATGSRARLYDIPGKDLPGMFTLRTLQDAERISAAVEGAKRAVIMGGGLVGIGTAISLRTRGLEVCVVVASRSILSQNLDLEGGNMLVRHLEANGIRFLFGTDVVEVLGNDRVRGVRLSDGRTQECGLVVSAKGVLMNSELAAGAGIATERGVLVDDHMRTSAADVYAAGDVAQAKDFLTGSSEVMTIWPVAAEQGKMAGMDMAGGDVAYPGGLQMNTVDFFGLPVVSIGETREPKDPSGVEALVSREEKAMRYRKVVLRDGRVVGAILIGDTESAGVYTGLMCTRVDVRAVRGLLLGKNFDYAKLVDAMLLKDPSYLQPS